MSDIADPSALPDTTTSCLAGVKEEGIHERKQAWSIISALVVALGSWSLSPLPILFGSKGLKASDTFTLQSKKRAGLSAEFPLSSCSANFHFLRVVIQRALASQMTHSTFLQPSFIAWHFHSVRKWSSHYLYFLLSLSPSSSPPSSFVSGTLWQLWEKKNRIFITFCVPELALGGLTAAQWRKWHQLLPRVSKPGAFSIAAGPWSGTAVSVGVLDAIFENKDSLIMVPLLDIICVFLSLASYTLRAANSGHQGRKRENGGRRCVGKPVTAQGVFCSASAMGNSSEAVSVWSSSHLAMLDDKKSTLMSTFRRPCRRWVPSKVPFRNFAGGENRE